MIPAEGTVEGRVHDPALLAVRRTADLYKRGVDRHRVLLEAGDLAVQPLIEVRQLIPARPQLHAGHIGGDAPAQGLKKVVVLKPHAERGQVYRLHLGITSLKQQRVGAGRREQVQGTVCAAALRSRIAKT